MNRPLPLASFARLLLLLLLVPALALAASACAADGGGRLAPAPGQAAIASAHHLATDAGFQVLDKGGITAANVATAQSMFGLRMFVKLDNDHVISIGKSDIAKFRAAKRGNADTAE